MDAGAYQFASQHLALSGPWLLICLIGLVSSCSRTAAPGKEVAPDVEVLRRMTAFIGGEFDASGVAAVDTVME